MCGPTARPWRWGRSRRRGHKGPSCARPRRRPPWAGLGRASRRASAGAALGAKGQEPSCAGAPRSCCAAGPAPRPSPRPPCSCREGAAAPGRRGGAVVGGHRRRRCPGEGPRRRGGQERARARLRSAPRRPRPAPARQGMMAPGLGPWLLALALAAGPAGALPPAPGCGQQLASLSPGSSQSPGPMGLHVLAHPSKARLWVWLRGCTTLSHVQGPGSALIGAI
ncbi:uncharacterized protein LOC141934239 isoform X2 [Strix aluco]|uniref:uncharacterized protein LOC141934238 isoform X2 n=1 Tax=Strix aluco TaxID=111821 RepID=UPI003DA3A1CC